MLHLFSIIKIVIKVTNTALIVQYDYIWVEWSVVNCPLLLKYIVELKQVFGLVVEVKQEMGQKLVKVNQYFNPKRLKTVN